MVACCHTTTMQRGGTWHPRKGCHTVAMRYVAMFAKQNSEMASYENMSSKDDNTAALGLVLPWHLTDANQGHKWNPHSLARLLVSVASLMVACSGGALEKGGGKLQANVHVASRRCIEQINACMSIKEV